MVAVYGSLGVRVVVRVVVWLNLARMDLVGAYVKATGARRDHRGDTETEYWDWGPSKGCIVDMVKLNGGTGDSSGERRIGGFVLTGVVVFMTKCAGEGECVD